MLGDRSCLCVENMNDQHRQGLEALHPGLDLVGQAAQEHVPPSIKLPSLEESLKIQ